MEMPLQCPSAAYLKALTTIPSEIKHCMLFKWESVDTSQEKLAGRVRSLRYTQWAIVDESWCFYGQSNRDATVKYRKNR